MRAAASADVGAATQTVAAATSPAIDRSTERNRLRSGRCWLAVRWSGDSCCTEAVDRSGPSTAGLPRFVDHSAIPSTRVHASSRPSALIGPSLQVAGGYWRGRLVGAPGSARDRTAVGVSGPQCRFWRRSGMGGSDRRALRSCALSSNARGLQGRAQGPGAQPRRAGAAGIFPDFVFGKSGLERRVPLFPSSGQWRYLIELELGYGI